VKLAKLSKPAVHAFKDELLGKGSRAMARKILVSLRSIIIEAQNRGLVGQNVAKDVKVDTKNREKPKLRVGRDIPSKAEVQEILSKAVDPDFPSFARWRPLLVTAMFTGMRSSELRGLTWDAVDIDRKVIHVHQRADAWGTMGPPKSEAGEREIPMSPMVVNALREWQLACPKGELGLVFPNGAGNVQAHSNIVARGWYAIQEKAGIVGPTGRHKYGFHSLRHFFASCAIEQEFSAKRLQALLGHSSITMTFDTYGHLFPSEEDDQAKFAAAEASVMRVV
jgi:integrase